MGNQWGPFWDWVPVHPLESFCLHTGRGSRHFQMYLPAALHFPSYPERRQVFFVFFFFLALRRCSLSSDVKQCLLQNAWINSNLKWIIHSLISQHLVASVSSILVRLRGVQLNVTENQQKSRLPASPPSSVPCSTRERWSHSESTDLLFLLQTILNSKCYLWLSTNKSLLCPPLLTWGQTEENLPLGAIHQPQERDFPVLRFGTQCCVPPAPHPLSSLISFPPPLVFTSSSSLLLHEPCSFSSLSFWQKAQNNWADLEPRDLPLRQGLHWGRAERDKVFMGQGLQAWQRGGEVVGLEGWWRETKKHVHSRKQSDCCQLICLMSVYPKCQ